MAITLIKSGKFAGRYRVRIQPVDKVTGKIIKVPSVVTKSTDRQEAVKLESQLWVKFHGEIKIENQRFSILICEKSPALGMRFCCFIRKVFNSVIC